MSKQDLDKQPDDPPTEMPSNIKYSPIIDPSEANLVGQKFLSSLNFYIRNSIRESKRKFVYYILALFSITLVVASTAVGQTVIDFAPLLFLKIAEASRAAIDIEIVPIRPDISQIFTDGSVNIEGQMSLFLNGSRIQSILDPHYPGLSTSRIDSSGKMSRILSDGGDNCNLIWVEKPNCQTYEVDMIIIESERENSMKIGENLRMPDEIPKNNVIIPTAIFKSMELEIGDDVYITKQAGELIRDLCFNYQATLPKEERKMNCFQFWDVPIQIRATVYDHLDSFKGRAPVELQEQLIFMEMKYFNETLADVVSEEVRWEGVTDEFIEHIRRQPMQDYTAKYSINLKDRYNFYKNPDYNEIQDGVVKISGDVATRLGIYPFEIRLPVIGELMISKYGSGFLGVALYTIVTVLFILSFILIYNLLMVTVESRNFDIGVMRMIGLNKKGVVELLLVQGMAFCIPGCFLGTFLSTFILSKVSVVLKMLIDAEVPGFPTTHALFFSITCSLIVTLFSAYYPLKEALTKNLNIALDLNHSKTSAVLIQLQFDAKMIPWDRIVFSLLTVVFGLSIYLFIPLALLTLNVGLLLVVFFGILIGLLLGFVLLSLNFQHLMERIVTRVFFCWASKPFQTLIVNNLVAHKIRNRRTSIMYAISLGFIIFITVSLNLELENIQYHLQQVVGSDLLIRSRHGMYIDLNIIEDYIGKHLSEYVQDTAYITQDIQLYTRWVLEDPTSFRVTHQGHLFEQKVKIRGVSPGFLSVTNNNYLMIKESGEEASALSLSEQLYTARGYQGCFVGSYVAEKLGISTDYHQTLQIEIQNKQHSKQIDLRVLAMLDSVPRLKMTEIPSTFGQDLAISIPLWMQLTNGRVNRLQDVPVYYYLIKVKDSNEEYIKKVDESLRKIDAISDGHYRLYNYKTWTDNLESSKIAITYIFLAVEVLVIILCLFSLITSMTTNITEQVKEIAILRALGMTRQRMVYLYVCEAFVLVASSSAFGILIGTIVSFTMDLQRQLFTQIPMNFVFPWKDTFVMLAFGWISAFISTYLPAKRIMEKQIATLVRTGAAK